MADVTLVLFHAPVPRDAGTLTALHGRARDLLLERHVAVFRAAGVDRVVVTRGRSAPRPAGAAAAGAAAPPDGSAPADASFGDALAAVVRDERVGACIVLSDGAVPLAGPSDARALVDAARSPLPLALTNNRYSSDVCAISDAAVLRDLPALPSDNVLPRWLEEVAGVPVRELGARERLAIDLDTPLDLAIVALAPRCPASLRNLASGAGVSIPRLDALRELAGDPRRELLVMGRSSSRTLAWLERHVRCRVRFLAEERGLRASSPLAIAPDTGGSSEGSATRPSRASQAPRAPRATLGRLLARDGAASLARHVADLADGAVLDSRVLLADRAGADEDAWPVAEDRFASDLLRPDGIADPWLRDLTASAAGAPIPILLGGHTLVGPGIPLLLRPTARRPRTPRSPGRTRALR